MAPPPPPGAAPANTSQPVLAKHVPEDAVALAERIARIGTWEWDLASDRVAWSPGLYRIYAEDPATSPASLEGYLERVHADHRDQVRRAVDRALETAQPFEHDYRIVRADGEVRWVHARGEPALDPATGALRAMRGYCQDITERKEMEEALAGSEDRFRALARTASDAIISADMRGNISYLNEAACGMFGYAAEELLGKPLTLLMPLRFREPHLQGLSRFRSTGEGRVIGRTVELTAVRRDGAEFPIELSLSTWSSGADTFFTGILRDITERKQGQAKVVESERRMAEAQAIARVGNWSWDLAAGRVAWSDELFRIHGLAPQSVEVTFDRATGWMHPDDVASIRADLARALATVHEPLQRVEFPDTEYRIRRTDGEERILLGKGTIIAGADGKPERIIGTVQDITERKRAELAQGRLRAELERSNRDLELFAYAASHDLQEPVRVVKGYLELLQRRSPDLDERAHQYVRHAIEGSDRMQRLITDLLQYSRVGTRGQPPQPADADVALAEALANLGRAIADAEATVTHDPLPTVLADPTQLMQVFQNLVGNAVKFRGPDPPRVHVSARLEGAWWEFRIADNGIGIPPGAAERLFVVFQRLHGEKYPGSGIGLALCRRIVERLGGHISVESEPGKGSTFRFTLPGVPA